MADASWRDRFYFDRVIIRDAKKAQIRDILDYFDR